jgi:hypothetical protein
MESSALSKLITEQKKRVHKQSNKKHFFNTSDRSQGTKWKYEQQNLFSLKGYFNKRKSQEETWKILKSKEIKREKWKNR